MLKHYKNQSDTLIWDDFRNGNPNAFEYIYQTYFPTLYNYGLHISKDEDIVKDCIQNLFVEIWKSHSNLSATDSIKYYLIKAVRRHINASLARSPFTGHGNEIDNNYEYQTVLSPEYEMINGERETETKQRIRDSVDKLTPRQREAITLIYFEQLSYAEVSSIMCLKIRTVYNTIHAALEVLKKLLSNFPSNLYSCLLWPMSMLQNDYFTI
ncbi:RNA polymerase sigma factor [Dyadobacter sp. NIV53]|uniref:RNA polymerase sigma factor n=1 Tax=Dyadobacter sp. NIV53 TaxID=2861765 RepID=UPI001C868982|nr:sigma-70 family RNA polymerase sigma factor [Dyadobacter sp. NIV53]